MAATVFNPIQQHLLMMFAYDSTEERLKEVKEVLMRYYAEKVEDRFNDLWDSGVLNQERLDEMIDSLVDLANEIKTIHLWFYLYWTS